MKTVMALYDVFADAQAAVSDLLQAGVDREAISLFGPDRQRTDVRNAGKAATPEGQNERDRAAALASTDAWDNDLYGLAPLAVPGIGPVMANGPLAAGFSGSAAGGAGGFAGVLLGWGIPDDEADAYAEGLRRGGTLLLVTVSEAGAEAAGRILNKYDPIDLAQRSAGWREAGWAGFDPAAQPYSGDDLTSEVAHATRGAFSKAYPYAGEMTYAAVNDPDAEFADRESSYRRHYDSHYAGTGRDYVDYQNAYRFGSTLGGSARYVDLGDWADVEPAARAQWEATHDGAWDAFKDAIRHGWAEMKTAVS
jgi:hypothetical protein